MYFNQIILNRNIIQIILLSSFTFISFYSKKNIPNIFVIHKTIIMCCNIVIHKGIVACCCLGSLTFFPITLQIQYLLTHLRMHLCVIVHCVKTLITYWICFSFIYLFSGSRLPPTEKDHLQHKYYRSLLGSTL